MRQTVVEFPDVTDNMRGSVQHSLQPVSYDLCCPSENCTAVVQTERDENVHKYGSRFRVERLSVATKLLKKPAAQTLAKWLSIVRSDEIVIPRRQCRYIIE